MSFRLSRFLPRFPAILLVPAVLGLWAAVTWARAIYVEGMPHYGFPLIFNGFYLEYDPREAFWIREEHGFRFTPLLIDLALALAAAWAFAMIIDRRLVPLIRGERRMSFRWPRFLPRFPALVLMPAVLGLWIVLCIGGSSYEWSPLYPETIFLAGSPWEGGPWDNPRGFPFTFSGRWELGVSEWHFWSGFQIGWFLLDLIIALAVAWAFPMFIDRVVFPLIRGKRQRHRGTGEAR